MRDKLTNALTMLKKASKSRGYLYEQPWYAIIGPPGAGKTTALLNAELEFPLAAQIGRGAVAGVGGTRFCEWWFTDQAVLIDTAGRYTTQDADAAVDRAGWEAFLDVLKRTRPRQPLSGVIVAIALNDIAQATTAERSAHATTIRQRVEELGGKLGFRLPVYLVFTKADLLAGFTEFFDDLDAGGAAQVWGVDVPLNRRRFRRRVRRRISRAGRAGRPAADLPAPGRGRSGQAGVDRGLSTAACQHGGGADRVHRRDIRRRGGADAAAARRLPDVRHAGRNAHRPVGGRHCAGFGLNRSGRAASPAGGTLLFSHAAAARRDLRRGDAGRARPAEDPAQSVPMRAGAAAIVTAGGAGRGRRADPDAAGQPVGAGAIQLRARHLHQYWRSRCHWIP